MGDKIVGEDSVFDNEHADHAPSVEVSVRDALAAGKYENKVPYSVEKVPVDEGKMTVRQAKEHVESERERQRAQHRLHNKEQARLTDLFQRDLEAENGVVGHPKADMLWRIAWDRGHSSGYQGVLYEYEELVDLLSPQTVLGARGEAQNTDTTTK